MKYAQLRLQWERVLQHGPFELRQITNASKSEVKRMDAAIAKLEQESAQAKADLREFEQIPWWE